MTTPSKRDFGHRTKSCPRAIADAAAPPHFFAHLKRLAPAARTAKALIDEGAVSAEDASRAQLASVERGIDRLDALVEQGAITSDNLARTRAKICEYPYADLTMFEVEVRNAELLPKPIADRYGAARVLAVGAVCAGLGFALRGIVTDPLPFVLTGVLVALLFAAISTAGPVPLADGPPDFLGDIEAVGRTARRDDRHRTLTVPAEQGLEEVGLLGVKAMDMSRLRAKRGFLMDNDTLDTIIIGGPTYFAIDVAVGGRSAHAGMEPEKGVNAIQAAAKAIMAVPEATPFMSMIDGTTVEMAHLPQLHCLPGERSLIRPSRAIEDVVGNDTELLFR